MPVVFVRPRFARLRRPISYYVSSRETAASSQRAVLSANRPPPLHSRPHSLAEMLWTHDARCSPDSGVRTSGGRVHGRRKSWCACSRRDFVSRFVFRISLISCGAYLTFVYFTTPLRAASTLPWRSAGEGRQRCATSDDAAVTRGGRAV